MGRKNRFNTMQNSNDAPTGGIPPRPDEDPVTAFRKSDLPEGAPVIHSFIVHPDGSVQDMKRYSNKQTADTVSEIRDSLQDLK